MTAFRNRALAGLAAGLAAVALACSQQPPAPSTEQAPRETSTSSVPNVVFASPGRVEGRAEATEVGAATDGVVRAVFAKEGQFVKKGEPLGQIGCDDLLPGLQTAQAEVDVARQAKARLLRGSRVEERKVASEKTAAARAAFKQAKSRLDMLLGLYRTQDISRAAYEQAVRDASVTEANLNAAIRTENLLAAPPLTEDAARADADVKAAIGRVLTVEAQIRKCTILSPMAGTVLRVYARPGEAYSTVAPHPLFSLADASVRRVRAEIDERDISRVFAGQNVIIQADALNGKEINGSVSRISAEMGRKSVFTGDPADKSDRDILEAVVDLKNDARALPIGLRVTVLFLAAKPPGK